MIDHH